MLPVCEHHKVDDWHVPTHEAAELVRGAGNSYSWRDQLRVETQGSVTKWMWPGLFALLTVSLIIRDALLIAVSVAAIVFFVWQAISVIRAMRRARTLRAVCSELELVSEGKTNKKGRTVERVWHAHTRFGGEAQQVVVVCPQFAKALGKAERLELLLLADPDDSGNHWLIGYRAQRIDQGRA